MPDLKTTKEERAAWRKQAAGSGYYGVPVRVVALILDDPLLGAPEPAPEPTAVKADENGVIQEESK
jgi:hypothetical protein